MTSYLNTEFLAIVNNPPFTIPFGITYDDKTSHFIFSTSVDIRDDTSCLDLLGIPSDYFTVFIPVTESIIPVNLNGPTELYVSTSLSLYTIPPSQMICKVPVTASYGNVVYYFDDGVQPSLCSEHHIQRLQIYIRDQDLNDIDGYDDFPWTAVISIEAIPNPGFSSAERIDRPNEEDSNIVIE